MVQYHNGERVTSCNLPRLVLQQTAIRKTILVSIPPAILSALLKVADERLEVSFLEEILPHDAAYETFVFIISLFIVFHTGHAYERLMRGAELLYLVMGEFADVVNIIFAFTRASQEDPHKVVAFRQQVVRLMSLLFAVCTGELEDAENKTFLSFSLIDLKSLDEGVLQRIFKSEHKGEQLNQLILGYLVDSIGKGILSLPAPLLSRVFTIIGECMVKCIEARAVKEIPFPIPFVLTAEVLLVFHFFATPFFMAHWAPEPTGAAGWTFLTVFSLTTLHMVASELDDPFGSDVNDLNTELMQEMLNQRLLTILEESMQPQLGEPDCVDLHARYMHRNSASMGIEETSTAMSMETELRCSPSFTFVRSGKDTSVKSLRSMTSHRASSQVIDTRDSSHSFDDRDSTRRPPACAVAIAEPPPSVERLESLPQLGGRKSTESYPGDFAASESVASGPETPRDESCPGEGGHGKSHGRSTATTRGSLESPDHEAPDHEEAEAEVAAEGGPTPILAVPTSGLPSWSPGPRRVSASGQQDAVDEATLDSHFDDEAVPPPKLPAEGPSAGVSA